MGRRESKKKNSLSLLILWRGFRLPSLILETSTHFPKLFVYLQDNYLFYCKTKTSAPQGIINLQGCAVAVLQGPTAKPYSFSLLAPKSVSVDARWTNR